MTAPQFTQMGNVVGLREDVFKASSEANGWESTFTWNAFNKTFCGGCPDYYIAAWHTGDFVEFVSIAKPTEKELGVKLGGQWLRCYQQSNIPLTDWTTEVNMKDWLSQPTPKWVDFSYIVASSTNSFWFQSP